MRTFCKRASQFAVFLFPFVAAEFAKAASGIAVVKDSAAAPSPTNRLTIAVIRFENRTGNTNYDHWKETISGLVAGQLYFIKSARIVPGTEYALGQIKDKKPITSAVAQKVGEIIEARNVAFGHYERTNDVWRAAIQIVNTATGACSPEFRAASTNWFDIRDSLTQQIIKELKLVPTEAEGEKMKHRWTTNLEALENLSVVIEMDESGAARGEIEKLVRKVIEADPRCAEAYQSLSAELGTQGRIEEAEAAIRKAISLRPEDASAHMTLGTVQLFQGHDEESELELKKATELEPDSLDAFERLGELCAKQGFPYRAAECYQTAVKLAPFSSSLHAHLGVAYAMQLRREKAESELREAERLLTTETTKSPSVNTEQMLGYAYDQLHSVPQAINYYEKFITDARKEGAQPELVEEFSKRLVFLKRSLTPTYLSVPLPKDFDGQSLSNAIKNSLDQNDFLFAVNPLDCTQSMKAWAEEQTKAATNDFDKAKSLFSALEIHLIGGSGGKRTAKEAFDERDSPYASLKCQEYALLYVALARSLGLPSYFVAVYQDYEGRNMMHACAGVVLTGKVLLVDPSFQWFGVPHKRFVLQNDLQTMAIYLCQQEEERARRIACKLDPESAVARINLILLLTDENKWEEARSMLPSALKVDPDGWMGKVAQALFEIHDEKFGEAIKLLENAVETQSADTSNLGQVHFMLAGAYYGQTNLPASRESFRRALQCPLSDSNAETARRAIATINEKIGN